MSELINPTEFGQEAGDKGQIHTDVLQNIPVTLSIEVGRAVIKIRDLMRLTQGSVVELDRIAGEPLNLLVNNTVVAQGEVVLVPIANPIGLDQTWLQLQIKSKLKSMSKPLLTKILKK